MDNILVPLLIGLVVVEIALYLIHRRRQRRFRAKDLADVPALDVWYLPAGWTSHSPPHVPPPPPPGSDPHFASSNPTSVARPPPTRHVAHHLRTRGYVALGIVEKWKGVPHPDDDALPRYSPISPLCLDITSTNPSTSLASVNNTIPEIYNASPIRLSTIPEVPATPSLPLPSSHVGGVYANNHVIPSPSPSPSPSPPALLSPLTPSLVSLSRPQSVLMMSATQSSSS